jgi:hypothetical protein
MAIIRIIGATLFIAFVACAISSSIVVSDMIEDINTVSDGKENPLFRYPGKLKRIKREYQRLYPNGERAKTLNRLMIACVVLLFVGAGLMLWPELG